MLNGKDSANEPSSVQKNEDAHPVATREPLAIVGIGCHFPGGANDPQAFWDLLCGGVDATREVPENRWQIRKFYDPEGKKAGKMGTYRGGYLDRLDQFDAQFFGISPREAMWLDPQQRLLLQVTWEAMEDAGLIADKLSGSNTGVFIGGFTLDYQLLQNYGVYSRYELQTHSATGMMMTILANRISYVFNFRGPSMAIDTACSGSLVATHLACQSIWNGECSLAIAGGVNAMMAPTMTIAESKAGFLAPDGRSKTFDSSANGYARGEGAGVVLIKPLSRAQADGDPIYALIRGTAVTQDGHTTGITVPNPEAQEAAMRQAYERANVSPSQIQYVEAHGTGTPVGDPLEARAIGTVVSTGRPEGEECLVGSVKTNIGHLEAAAGVAGLVKTALSLKHRQIPPHLHLRNPNPAINFEELQLRVPTTLEAWPESDGPALAGVNSFGFGGTNAHVVLQEAPAERIDESDTEPEKERPYLLPLSARSAEALRATAESYRSYLASTEARIHDIVYSASQRRSHHDHRLALPARTKAEAVSLLDAYLADEARQGTTSGRIAPNGRPQTVFVCSGMGPQWWAMGRDLLENEPVFRASIERCSTELERHTGWSLLDEFRATEENSRMASAEVAEPANFALQIGLADLWRSWGIEPDAYIGHSTGEFAAHYLAGVLSFEDAIKLVYHHSRLQQRNSGKGRMLAIGMSYETLSKAVLGEDDPVAVAAINAPTSVTISGDIRVLENYAQQLETFQVFHRFVQGRVPYHSQFVEDIREELLTSLADLKPQHASRPLYSTVTGTRIDGRGADASYWYQNARSTVLFSSALSQMIQDGYSVFIELAPHPVLAHSIDELLTEQGQEGKVVASLRREEEDRTYMLGSLGTLYTLGYPVNWATLNEHKGRYVRLPLYPWQFKTYWTESLEAHEDRFLTQVHPLLGQRMGAVHPTWECEISSWLLPYLADHRIQESVLLPGAAYAEMALAAAREVFGEGSYAVEELQFRKAMFLPDSSDPRIQTVLDPERALVEISSYVPDASGDARWSLHATAKLRLLPVGESTPRLDLKAIRQSCTSQTTRDEFYTLSRQMGFQYGPAFQAIEHLEVGTGVALAHLQVPASIESDLDGYSFHPSMVDAAFQALLIATQSQATATNQPSISPYLPVGVDRISIFAPPQAEMRAVARVVKADSQVVVGDIEVTDLQGNVLAAIIGFRAQSLEASMSQSPERIDRGLYELEWQPQERVSEASEATEGTPESETTAGSWLIFADQGGVAAELVKRLERQGIPHVTVSRADVTELRSHDARQYALNPTVPEQFQQLVATLTEKEQTTFSTVAHLWNLDATFKEDSPISVLEQDQAIGTLSIMYMVQALAQSGWSQTPRVWLVTCGAQAVGPVARPLSISQAPAWGLGRVIGHQEFPNMWGGMIDVDQTSIEEQARAIYEELSQPTQEDQIAYRDGQRYIMRMVHSANLTPAMPPTFRVDGSYLITGGLGNLGLLVARWMATQGARRLILMGRTPLPARSTWQKLEADHPQRSQIEAIRELEALGATVHIAVADASNEEQLTIFLRDYEAEGWPPIRGVVHTAGIVKDDLLLRMTTENFTRVLQPKVYGGWLLHRLLKDAPLDFFVLFASTGSVIASVGQGNYAAGNAFLDALAHHRRALGLPAMSIGWGPWSIGMVQQLNLEQFYTRRGIDLITPAIGTQVMARVLDQRPAHLTVISANWTTARETSPMKAMPPMFSQLLEQADDTAATEGASDDGSFLRQLGEAAAAERQPMLITHLQGLVARVLQLDATQFGPQESLTSLGLDSMLAIEIKHRIEASLKTEISVLELLKEVTIAQLATRILSALPFEGVPTAGEDAATLTEIQELVENANGEDLESLLAELEGPQDDLEQALAELQNDDLESLLSELEGSLDSEANV